MEKTQHKKLKMTYYFLTIFAIGMAFVLTEVTADTATGTVTVGNSVPSMGTITLWNQAGNDAAITLSAGSTVSVNATVTITDSNGGADITSANATLFHSTSSSEAADDENIHLTNASCTLSEVDGNTKNATCAFTLDFMALNGTWTVNITAIDNSSELASGTDDNTVNDLAALDVIEATVDFASLGLGANSSSATTMTIRSQGNILIDARFSGLNYTCTSGEIPVGNTRYSTSTGNYDSMATDLTESATTQTAFDLGVRGDATANGANSDKSEFWTIMLPTSGISGTCTNTLTVDAISG